MKGRHVVRRIIVRTILIPEIARSETQKEHGHAEDLVRKQQMALLPLRLKMQQKLNAHVLHIVLLLPVNVEPHNVAEAKMGVHILEQ